MIPSKRKSELLHLICEDGYASVAYLAGKMHVSESTIRRDLDELQNDGQIVRTHGGVESISSMILPIDRRYSKNKRQKTEIARRAAELIGGSRLIYIDNSSTASYLVSFLPKSELTVWTNGAETALIFSKAGFRTISTGGELYSTQRAYIGGYTLASISHLHFDAAFFSSSGIDANEISDYAEQETIVRRAVLERSARRYFLCDTSKLGQHAQYEVCKLDQVTAIVTEDGIYSPEELRELITHR